jgi:hypothetical protein
LAAEFPEYFPMANPWTKKNPFLSLWLSNANAAAGRGKSAATAALARQQSLAIKKATNFWTGAWLAPAKSRKRR